MAKINLLPIELSPSRGSVKIAATIKKTTIIVSGIFLFGVLIGVMFILLLTSQAGALSAKEKTLTQNIQSLQSTEQQLFLVKDRISKIKQVYSSPGAETSFDSLNTILTNLPPNVSVDSVEIDTTKTKFSVLSKDSLGMATFLNSLVTNGTYKNLTLTGFIFTPDRGYLITLEGS